MNFKMIAIMITLFVIGTTNMSFAQEQVQLGTTLANGTIEGPPQPPCILQNTSCSSSVADIIVQLPAANNNLESLGRLRVEAATNLNNTHSMDDKAYLESLLVWIDKTIPLLQQSPASTDQRVP